MKLSRMVPVGLLAALVVLPLAPMTPTASADRHARPSHRPAARAHAAFLVGNRLHVPSGRVVRLPIKAYNAGLLGHTKKGWIVGRDLKYGAQYVAYDHGSIAPLGPRIVSPPTSFELLGSDGTHVVGSIRERDEDTQAVREIGVDGSLQDLPGMPLPAAISDATGGHVYATSDGCEGCDEPRSKTGIFDLVAGADEAVQLTDHPATLVDVKHDVAFVDPSDSQPPRSGPVSFSAILAGEDPAPRWRVASFYPTKISPDGTRVLGYVHTAKGTYVAQVRRMSDGRLLRALATTHDNYLKRIIGWDGPGSGAILQVVYRHGGRTQYLRRCVIATGRCARLTPVTKDPISLPTALAGRAASW